MHLSIFSQAPDCGLTDIYGEPIKLGQGRPTLLTFFRDAACPFCNVRFYELYHRYEGLVDLGLEVVVVFASDRERIEKFVAQRRRPFQVAGDPNREVYERYGLQTSLLGKLIAITTRVGSLIEGLKIVGLAGLDTNNMMPADFIIDDKGRIVTAYYGRDAGDHVPFERIESFALHYLIDQHKRERRKQQRRNNLKGKGLAYH